ncbi:MAG: hypothetical protein A3D18_05110 [Chlamydiae bacterium RIFCSPHIGHO2_02_FULL_49_29]|nr:MAG: hypothetical protein A3D18_05110 [Chlamydiae bacterium RIFCSPHIGHO2_02_FULL_49_29]
MKSIVFPFLFFCLLGMRALDSKTLCLIPFEGCSAEEMFFFPEIYKGENLNRFYLFRELLEEAGYSLKFSLDQPLEDDLAAVISFNRCHWSFMAQLMLYPKSKRWLFCFEPPVVMPQLYHSRLQEEFDKIFVMFDEWVDNRTWHKFYYPQPKLQQSEPTPDFSKKMLCCMINNNKYYCHPDELYSERRNIISFFSFLKKEEFDLYGGGWQGYCPWKGTIPNKVEVLKNYRFCICYENMKNQRGYITEKIFDCLISGCVPVYLGADNITDYIPQECFIDRRKFSSHEELYRFLKQINKERYQVYLNAAKSFLESPQAALFSVEAFTKMILNHLEEKQS